MVKKLLSCINTINWHLIKQEKVENILDLRGAYWGGNMWLCTYSGWRANSRKVRVFITDLSVNSGALARASGARWISKSTHPRKFGNHVTVHWPPRHPFAPQAQQCLLSHFLATLGAQGKIDCTSMLWSIGNCQDKVSADQYHLTVSRAQVSTHPGRVLFWSYPVISY